MDGYYYLSPIGAISSRQVVHFYRRGCKWSACIVYCDVSYLAVAYFLGTRHRARLLLLVPCFHRRGRKHDVTQMRAPCWLWMQSKWSSSDPRQRRRSGWESYVSGPAAWLHAVHVPYERLHVSMHRLPVYNTHNASGHSLMSHVDCLDYLHCKPRLRSYVIEYYVEELESVQCI